MFSRIANRIACSAAVATALAALNSQSARASGFTGNFAPANSAWTFTLNELTPQPTPICNLDFSACVEILDPDAYVYNDTGAAAYVEWTWSNTFGVDYFVGFDYFLDTEPNSGATATITLGEEDPILISAGDESGAISSPVRISNGQSISFRVETINNESAVLTITNFNAEVPAPLPAAGAATAFGYSRRLRRRIKGKPAAGSCPQVLPAHPSAYLNLAPSSLKSVPVSFGYAVRPDDADPSQKAA